MEGVEKVVGLIVITVVQDIKQIDQIQQKRIQNVFKMDYTALVLTGILNIIGTSSVVKNKLNRLSDFEFRFRVSKISISITSFENSAKITAR